MSSVRDYSDELDGYAYLPRMFDKARAELAGDGDAPPFGCPLDHSCMARLGVYPEDVLGLVRVHGRDDDAILAGLKSHGIPSAEETWFDARATEDELRTGVYLKVREREQIDELRPPRSRGGGGRGRRGALLARRQAAPDRARRAGGANPTRAAA